MPGRRFRHLLFFVGRGEFGSGEIKLGWMGGCGNTQLLPRLIGYGKGMQMTLTGDLIDAPKAYRLGLIQELWPADENSPFGAAYCRECSHRG